MSAGHTPRPPLPLLIAIGLLAGALLWRVLGLNAPAAGRRCTALYTTARTTADSLAVDATIPDTMRPGLHCAAFRTGTQ